LRVASFSNAFLNAPSLNVMVLSLFQLERVVPKRFL
jgi:hypothetical protein